MCPYPFYLFLEVLGVETKFCAGPLMYLIFTNEIEL